MSISCAYKNGEKYIIGNACIERGKITINEINLSPEKAFMLSASYWNMVGNWASTKDTDLFSVMFIDNGVIKDLAPSSTRAGKNVTLLDYTIER